MRRRNSRIIAMIVMYIYDIRNEIMVNDVISLLENEENFNDIEYDLDFVNDLVLGTITNLREIDHIISLNLKNYTLDRLSYVDKSILRLGTYELKFTESFSEVIINEMIEISKEYTELDDYKTSKFNNAVLESIRKAVQNG